VGWNQWLESLRLPGRLELNGSELRKIKDERFVSHQIVERGRELSAICDVRQGLAVCMSPADGAELSALAVYDDAQWNELLYRGNEWARIDDWPGRAPWLWPVAGRCYAPSRASSNTVKPDRSEEDCSWHWNGARRTMPCHGFARHQAWHSTPPVATAGGVTSAAHLLSDPSHRDIYPFDYHLSTSQELSNNGLEISFRVEASSENSGPMPFALGLHFSFDFSSWWGDNWLQGSVEHLGRFAWKTDKMAQASERFELPSDSICLLDPALKSEIIPARIDEPVRLVCPDGSRALEMSFEKVSAASEKDLVWVSYLDPQNRFFCLEPWVGWPNAINSGRGRVDLQPGQVWQFRLRLSVTPFSRFPQSSSPAVRQIVSPQ